MNPIRPWEWINKSPGIGLKASKMIQAEAICDKAEYGVDGEERHHDRAEEGRNPGCASALGREQQHEDDDRRRQHIARQIGVDLFQAFERGKDGNRRSDDRVAGKQGRPGDAEQKHDRGPSPEGVLRERHQRQGAAFALVVGLHQEQHIFPGDDEQQRPDDERDDADDLRGPSAPSCKLTERRLQGIERARADIAEHNADRAERQNPEIP